MGLWPAPRRSKRRTSGQSTSTDPLPTLRALSDWDGSGTIPHLLSTPWSILWHMTAKTREFRN
jgi:hypothetical protein